MSEKPSLPTKPVPQAAGMLPGMAMIAIFMLAVALLGVFGAINNRWNTQGKYVVLPIATVLVIGVFGFLRLKRWGWAIVTAGALLLSLGHFYNFATSPGHSDFGSVIMGGLALVFFLYLVRQEIRERVH